MAEIAPMEVKAQNGEKGLVPGVPYWYIKSDKEKRYQGIMEKMTFRNIYGGVVEYHFFHSILPLDRLLMRFNI